MSIKPLKLNWKIERDRQGETERDTEAERETEGLTGTDSSF